MINQPIISANGSCVPTEELFASTTLLDYFNESRLQLLDGRNMICEHTHLAGLRGEVDLDDVLRLVDRLLTRVSPESTDIPPFVSFAQPALQLN
jgi:hypothetical protein